MKWRYINALLHYITFYPVCFPPLHLASSKLLCSSCLPRRQAAIDTYFRRQKRMAKSMRTPSRRPITTPMPITRSRPRIASINQLIISVKIINQCQDKRVINFEICIDTSSMTPLCHPRPLETGAVMPLATLSAEALTRRQ